MGGTTTPPIGCFVLCARQKSKLREVKEMTKREKYEVEVQLLDKLQDEIHAIATSAPYSKSKEARGALQLISCWAMEEAVEPVDIDD